MALKVKIIATDSLSGSLLRISKNVMRLGMRFAKIGILAAGVISGIAIKLQKDLDRGLREIGTLMGGLTDKQIKGMTKELENLASTSGQAMNSLTKAKYDIVSAGFTKAADSAIMLNQSAVIAVGGVTDMATAADLLTTALNAYNKSADEAADVSDILFTTVRLGKTTMSELGGSMGRLLAISGQMNISLPEMGAALATLTAGGQNTAEATTAIRASIVQLMQPQATLTKLIKDTEYETTLALLASEGYAGALEVIKNEADKAGVPMTDLFNNVRAMQAVLPLTGLAWDKFTENIAEFEKRTGSASGAYDEMQKSFQVVTDRLKQNVNNMLRALGRELIKKLQPKIEAFNANMEKMGELNWQKLANILIENWSKILLALGEIAISAGSIVGIALMDAIITEIQLKQPALIKEVNKIIKLLQIPGEAMLDLINFLAGIKKDEFLPDDAIKTSAERIAELKTNISNISAALVNLFVPAFVTATEVIESFNKETEKTPDTTGFGDIEKIKMNSEEYLRIVQDITNAVGNIHGNFLNMRKAQIQSELDAQIGAVLASGLAEEEKDAKISNLREAARRKEIAAAKAMKPIQIAQAISNTALAVVKALASTTPPWNFVLAGLVGAAGAAEIATIAAQPYAKGGFIRMGGNVPMSDTIPAMLSPNEIVSSAAATERFGNEINRLNQLAEGGFSMGGGGDKFYISAIDSSSFLQAVRKNPRKFAEAMQLVKSERYL